MSALTFVSKLMHRRYSQSPTFGRVLQTIWYQINQGQEIYVVGRIQDDKTVKGGTGWGATASLPNSARNTRAQQ